MSADVPIGQVVVIDAGTRNIRLGRAFGSPGKQQPAFTVPPAVGRKKPDPPPAGAGAKRAFDARPTFDDLIDKPKERVTIGAEAVAHSGSLDLSWPIQNGRVKNWVGAKA